MSSKRYPEEFKIEAVKQVTERGHTVADDRVDWASMPTACTSQVDQRGQAAGRGAPRAAVPG
jgi:hypothetical protein